MKRINENQKIMVMSLSAGKDEMIFETLEQYKNTSNCTYSWYDNPEAENLYMINSASDLRGFEDLISIGETTFAGQTVKLASNIDLQGVTKAGYGLTKNIWIPIGFGTCRFEGTFNGAGHTIKNIYIDEMKQEDQGFFRSLGQGAVIKNLNILNSIVHGNRCVGGLVGRVPSASSGILIRNCTFSGEVVSIGEDSSVGGIAGDGFQTTISDCTVSGQIKNMAASDSVSLTGKSGGIIGYGRGCMINNCTNKAVIISKTNNTGGITGSSLTGLITMCHNLGNISGYKFTGGIVGKNMSNAAVTKCTNKGIVISSSAYTGGIAGSTIGDAGSIDSCLNEGNIVGVNGVGGVVGYSEGASVKNSVNCGSVIGQSDVGGIAGYNEYRDEEQCWNVGEIRII